MNEQEKKYRFGVIDAAILLFIIACVIGIALRNNLAALTEEKEANVGAEISFLISDIAPSSLDALHVGDDIVIDNAYHGMLKNFEASNARAVIENTEGYAVTVEKPTRRDVRGVISVEGSHTDEGFLLDGKTYIAAGKELSLKTRDYRVTVLVTGIKLIG